MESQPLLRLLDAGLFVFGHDLGRQVVGRESAHHAKSENEKQECPVASLHDTPRCLSLDAFFKIKTLLFHVKRDILSLTTDLYIIVIINACCGGYLNNFYMDCFILLS